MSNDDSFNDGDEVFSLYSSKKVTDTFRAQLKKIAANNHLTSAFSHAKKETNECKKAEKNQTFESEINIEKEETTPAPQKSTEPDILIVDELPGVPVNTRINGSDSSENLVEIITAVPGGRTRQSERLKHRNRNTSNPTQCQLSNSTTNTPVHRRVTRRRTKASKGKKLQNKPLEITLEDSPQQSENDDELNPEVSVKVIWKSVNVKKFIIRKFQKLSYVFELLSKEENIPEDKIMLTFNNVRVTHSDTPDSLNLQVYHFLDGGVLSELSNVSENSNSLDTNHDDNSVTIKFQDVSKKIITIKLNRDEKLKVGMIKCSEQLDIPLNKIKFLFDGDLLNPSETPLSLGLEDGEIVDIKIHG